MTWRLSHRADPAVVPIADRHYNRQKIGAPQFAPPGRCFVLSAGTAAQLAEPWTGGAFWITSWPFAEYVKHAWAGAWINSAFRNEGAGLSSTLITEAIAATLAYWPEPPALGLVTFVNAAKVRHKRDVGWCYRRAGFKHIGFTEGGLHALQLLPANMPAPSPATGHQFALISAPSPSAIGGTRE